MQVLVDADNLSAARLAAVLAALPREADVVVAGSPRALAVVRWPAAARVVEVVGWQQADVVLAAAYRRSREPLVLVSGDGDFSHLVRGHRGPVLVVSDRPAAPLRAAATVVDPVVDGVDALRAWFDAVEDPGLDDDWPR